MGFEHLGFDAEERTWESLRKIHSSAPDFVLKELRKLRLTRALKGISVGVWNLLVIACDFVLVLFGCQARSSYA